MKISKRNWAILCLIPIVAACTTKPPSPTQASVPRAAGSPVSPVSQSTIAPGSVRDFQVNVGDTIHFAYDRFAIDGSERAILDRQAEWLNKYKSVRVSLEGHCDERGTRAYNLALGARRAEAAKQYLEQDGVSSARMSTLSYGKERPVCSESTATCWAQNRRAVTIVSGVSS